MRRFCLLVGITVIVPYTALLSAEPIFINLLKLGGATLDATREPGANGGRLGFFSDVYFDPVRDEWWGLSDRGPGGGVLSYATRVQRFKLDVHPVTGRISRFRVKETITFTDPQGLLLGSSSELNGLNPLVLNGHEGILGRSFDPEGLVIDPRTGHLIAADEYGPSVYEFDRKGRLLKVFETPANLVPRVDAQVNYVALRDACPVPNLPVNPSCGANAGRQDNRGFEGLAITPDGTKLVAVMQDPLVNEPPPNNGRTGRNVRVVVFDNDHRSPSNGVSIAQYAYQLELQADVAARINALKPGDATAADPRQGRNIGLSAIVALNDTQFLVLERDNRGIGVDDPTGERAVGTKRVYKIDITGATDVSSIALPAGDLPADVIPVDKSGVFIDLTANSVLPSGKQTEKWEGITIGPRLRNGARLILAGNDNDYSVTQNGSNIQFDVYVDFDGNFAKCVLDDPSMCELNPDSTDQTIDDPVGLPEGYELIPGVLHAYRASASDLEGYVQPGRQPRRADDSSD